MPIEFICEECGGKFSVPPSRAARASVRWCSLACRQAAGWVPPRGVRMTCEFCGGEFRVTPSRADAARFCSTDCYDASRRNRVTKECEVCKQPFEVKASEASGRITCSWACRVKRLRGPIHPSWTGGYVNYYRGDWPSARRLALARANFQCEICGMGPQENGRDLSVHHLKPYKAFADPLEANQQENLVALCRRCHQILEHSDPSDEIAADLQRALQSRKPIRNLLFSP